MWVAERGRPKSDDPANNITSVRLTSAEHQMVKKAADLVDLRLGQYMRAKVVEAAQFDVGGTEQAQEAVQERPDEDATDTDR